MDPNARKPRAFPAFLDILIIFGAVLIVSLTIRSFHSFGPYSKWDPNNACINNLRQIDGAKQQWAIENRAPSNAVSTWPDIQPYLGRGTGGTLPTCPQGGTYTIGSLTNLPTCSIKGHTLN